MKRTCFLPLQALNVKNTGLKQAAVKHANATNVLSDWLNHIIYFNSRRHVRTDVFPLWTAAGGPVHSYIYIYISFNFSLLTLFSTDQQNVNV